MALPSLRDELSIFPGPVALSGAPTWSIYDPVRNLYFRIDWPTFEILCRWSLDDSKAIESLIAEETTLALDDSAVESVSDFLVKHDLVQRDSPQQTIQLDREFKRRKRSWHSRLLQSYLFFRVPLVRPDRWLEETLPYVRWLGSTAFFFLSVIALLLGVFLVGRQWDQFTSTLVDLFSLKGLLAYAITLVGVKILHEFGHAYTAKNFGCRVPTLGVAFLVLFPMAYTDVNDAWRLHARSQRLRVGGAGIWAELIIAAWSTLLWAVVPDGTLRTGFFLLATTTWVSTLIINASPFLRFDGYFLLMDALEMPNLHSRAFALTRWRLRETLFGLGDEKPEHHSGAMERGLTLFAMGTWVYRLIVFGGIAVLVYLMFPKPLGPILGAVEIYWFILKPILGELKIWIERRSDIVKGPRTFFSLGVLALLAVSVTIPWDARIDASGVLVASQNRSVVSMESGRIKAIYKSTQSVVNEADVLIELTSPDINARLERAQARLEGLTKRLTLAELAEEQRGAMSILRAQLTQIEAEVKGLTEQQSRLAITAPIAGEFTWHDLELKSGDWIAKSTELGRISQLDGYRVVAYVEQNQLKRLSIGDTGLFIDEAGRLDPIALNLVQIDTDVTRNLGHPILASAHGGELLVREASEQLRPEQAIYRVVLVPQSAMEAKRLPELRGRITIKGEPEAWIAAYYRNFIAILNRESGF